MNERRKVKRKKSTKILRPNEDSSSLFFVQTKILRLYFSSRRRFFVFIFRSQSSLFHTGFLTTSITPFWRRFLTSPLTMSICSEGKIVSLHGRVSSSVSSKEISYPCLIILASSGVVLAQINTPLTPATLESKHGGKFKKNSFTPKTKCKKTKLTSLQKSTK